MNMTGNPPSFTLADIEGCAKNYRQGRDLLASRVQQLQKQMDQLRRQAEPLIRSALQATKAAENELTSAIACSPTLFKRPKTVVFHGVKVGFEKGKGKVTIADKDKTVALIKKYLSEEQQELLIKVTEKPIKSAIASLPVSDLKRIGAEVTDTGEIVVVRPVDSELDKALDALLKADSVEAQEADED
jgi:hypothetical protein